MSGELRLLVRTEEKKFLRDPKGFCSQDDAEYRDTIGRVCHQNAIPHSRMFVSVEVRGDEVLRPRFHARSTIQKQQLADSYGQFLIELKPDVVSELALVCAGDFQNTIVNFKEKNSFDLHDRVYVFNEAQGVEERWGLLRDFVEKAVDLVQLGYAEARLFRALRTSDKV